MNKELLKQCRWYDGREIDPYSFFESSPVDAVTFWYAEKFWVEQNGKAAQDSLWFLEDCGLSDEELIKDGAPAEILSVPIDLRALIFEVMNNHCDFDPEIMAKDFIPTMKDYFMGQAGSTSM